ncbi:MAG: hypothetical protein K9W42_05100 [Candidatus Heimdallarchaeota archaeon]|nr:hypothetical protein [Candidatus Heimdallarchaeota archaeon]
MTLVYSQFECPNCHKKTLTKIGKMIRCTCGWWLRIDEMEDIATKTMEYASIVAS